MKKTVMGLLCLGLMACEQEPALVDESEVLVSMGEYQITEQYVKAFLLSQGMTEPTQEQFDEALDQLVKEQALAMQAVKHGLKLSLDQALNFKRLQTRTMAQLAEEKYLIENPITDDMLQAEYLRVIGEVGDQQFWVQHLLYADEGQAQQSLAEIQGGKPYNAVQAEYLSGHGRRVKNVGDIGWVNLKQVPESFRNPLRNMAPGSTHDAVVISQFGAHVLHLSETRQAEPPPFDLIKDRLKQSLEQKSLERYRQLAQLKAKPKNHQK